jgi:hypothetical protein
MKVQTDASMAMGKRPGAKPTASPNRREADPRCSVCRRRRHKVHRSRKTGKLVCTACADRARMRVGTCVDCTERKLLQARGRCFACYKRRWRSLRHAALMRRARGRTRTRRAV